MRTQLLCVSLWLFTQCLAAQEVQILHEAVSDHPLGSSVQAYSQTKLAEIVEYRTRVEECTAEGCVCVCVCSCYQVEAAALLQQLLPTKERLAAADAALLRVDPARSVTKAFRVRTGVSRGRAS